MPNEKYINEQGIKVLVDKIKNNTQLIKQNTPFTYMHTNGQKESPAYRTIEAVMQYILDFEEVSLNG